MAMPSYSCDESRFYWESSDTSGRNFTCQTISGQVCEWGAGSWRTSLLRNSSPTFGDLCSVMPLDDYAEIEVLSWKFFAISNCQGLLLAPIFWGSDSSSPLSFGQGRSRPRQQRPCSCDAWLPVSFHLLRKDSVHTPCPLNRSKSRPLLDPDCRSFSLLLYRSLPRKCSELHSFAVYLLRTMSRSLASGLWAPLKTALLLGSLEKELSWLAPMSNQSHFIALS